MTERTPVSEMAATLERITHYAECALEQFKDGNGHLDISGFNYLIVEARKVLGAPPSAIAERKAIGLFWQTSDGKWHFSPGSTKRGDIHDNGRPIHVAYLGEEAK